MSQYVYKHPRPTVTADLVALAVEEGRARVLLVRRGGEPFAGWWALPGGFVGIEEAFEDAARRELEEETGLAATGPVAFLGVFGRPGRDPRGRTVSIALATLIPPPVPDVEGDDDAAEAAWFDLDEATGLAFDHDAILDAARAWLGAGSPASDPDGPRYAFPFGDRA